jgi:hypothetical protein
MRRPAFPLLAAWTVCLALSGSVGCTSTVSGTAVGAGDARDHTAVQAGGLPALLLSLKELKELLKFSDMATTQTWTAPDGRGVFDPAACVGAIFSGMSGSFDGSAYRDFYEVRSQDVTSEGQFHWVDQGVVAFDDGKAAQAFVTGQVTSWRQCNGKQFKYAFPGPQDWGESYVIGTTTQSGCVAMVNNTVVNDKRYDDIRLLAVKSSVVVDLQFTGFSVSDEPIAAVTRILDRIPSQRHECAFWG